MPNYIVTNMTCVTLPIANMKNKEKPKRQLKVRRNTALNTLFVVSSPFFKYGSQYLIHTIGQVYCAFV
ncbi:hypothetical protein XENTR_v10019049 [Xenopus tropicalis]|nr:hypothetical protein XENTR_v10019049 [Xenopus tropicalis]